MSLDGRAPLRRVAPILALALAATASRPAAAQRTVIIEEEEAFPVAEIGVQAGAPTGLSFKYWRTPFSALQGGLTWSFPDEGYSFSLDYVAHSYALRRIEREPRGFRAPLYAGFGVKALRLASDDPVLGGRFPLGLTALMTAVPVSFFAEVAPGVLFEDEGPVLSADAGVGARVYF